MLIKHRFLLITPAITTEADSPTHWKLQVLPAHLLDLLRLNEDLAEALALGHDIGHPPLGHAGEDTLDELLREAGGFNHNRQALRIMTLLEQRYPDFPGLNLSQEVLDAQSVRAKLPTAPPPLLETQVVDAADSIAYDTHDADDAIELGFVQLHELLELPLVAKAAEHVGSLQWKT